MADPSVPLNWAIYVLKHPRTHEVRYIGFTTQSLEERLKEHIQDALHSPRRTRRIDWVFSLISIGLDPLIELLQRGSGDGWREAERSWIAKYGRNGARLINMTAGGDGALSCDPFKKGGGRQVINLSGHIFGRLTVVERAPNRGDSKNAHWRCRCECGTETVVASGNLRRYHVLSCGCWARELTRERQLKHGMWDTTEHVIWTGMRARCFNPNAPNFNNYGGRGITVCARWHDFAAFYADMGARPSPLHTLDRIDTEGNYEPANCRWSTMGEQQNNKRSNVMVEYLGEQMTLMQAIRQSGMNYQTVYSRIFKHGWTIEQALTTRACLKTPSTNPPRDTAAARDTPAPRARRPGQT